MPESNVARYRPDARNNFDVVRPAPICTEANPAFGQCHNIHVSTNCYYGYHDPKTLENVQPNTDCEMLETPQTETGTPVQTTTRKRSADHSDYPKSKRMREDMQREESIEPETNETAKLNSSAEDLLETLYWNIHGGNIYDLIQCVSMIPPYAALLVHGQAQAIPLPPLM